MPRRTAEASKAIREAWQKEQKLVSEGKGTRDWTPEQQKEILEFGKAYYHSNDPNDVNDGKAFEGHHMKSAEAYPEYQGEPENIQLLSQSEHQEAHGGNFRNPTNGYFDPVTKVTFDFGDNKYVPCEIIKLTDPIVKLSSVKQETSKTTEIESEKDSHALKMPSVSTTPTAKSNSTAHKNIGEKIIDFFGAVKDFFEKHPIAKEAIKESVIAAATAAITEYAHSGKGASGGSKLFSPDEHFSSSSEDGNADSIDSNAYDDVPSDRDYPEERVSPKEHTVSADSQRYHTRNGVIQKEKESYQRGGKLED